ncbi:cell wall hydrolase [Aureimonas populi]|uniref:Cell wall hydrolase n=1 Tax=Aureimonas populi TaxID=1701758 RepID=A0ABW5CG23_9HYPH|nr:cell wall hydrolase [Aureimonas populi]
MNARLLLPLLALGVLVSGCATAPVKRMGEIECMARAMYFESNRSSEEGMIAVGTVVMNRVNSSEFPDTVCAVVGQKNQFAPGVLTREMGAGRELATRTAQKVLRGARHSQVGRRSMFFHTAGHSFPYSNMHYVAIAGGNAFYEKRRDASVTQEEVRRRQAGRSAGQAAAAPTPVRASPPGPAAGAALAPMSIEDVIRASR